MNTLAANFGTVCVLLWTLNYGSSWVGTGYHCIKNGLLLVVLCRAVGSRSQRRLRPPSSYPRRGEGSCLLREDTEKYSLPAFFKKGETARGYKFSIDKDRYVAVEY